MKKNLNDYIYINVDNHIFNIAIIKYILNI